MTASDDIRSRVAAITPLQWRHCQDDKCICGMVWAIETDAVVHYPPQASESLCDDLPSLEHQHADSVFIAHAPDDIRFLLSEVERLQTALAAAERERDAAVGERAEAVATLDGAYGLLWYFMDMMNCVAIDYDGWEAHRKGDNVTIEQAARQHDDAAEGSGER